MNTDEILFLIKRALKREDKDRAIDLIKILLERIME